MTDLAKHFVGAVLPELEMVWRSGGDEGPEVHTRSSLSLVSVKMADDQGQAVLRLRWQHVVLEHGREGIWQTGERDFVVPLGLAAPDPPAGDA